MQSIGKFTQLFGFLGGASGKELPTNTGDISDAGSNPGSGRSPGGGHGNLYPSPFSSVLVWRTPWTEKPGGLQSMGSQRVHRVVKGGNIHTT